MAKQTAKKVTKKRVKKNIDRGQEVPAIAIAKNRFIF